VDAAALTAIEALPREEDIVLEGGVLEVAIGGPLVDLTRPAPPLIEDLLCARICSWDLALIILRI
jgi:hypothetical protein